MTRKRSSKEERNYLQKAESGAKARQPAIKNKNVDVSCSVNKQKATLKY